MPRATRARLTEQSVEPDTARKPPDTAEEVVSIIRRVFSENARDYIPQYVLAIAFLLAVAATTAFTAWLMRYVVDDLFYYKRYELVPLICSGIVAAFVIRGLSTYGQAVILARIGNNLVARYQQRTFDHLTQLGMDFFSEARSGHLAARINQNVTGIRDLLTMTLTSIARDAITLIGLLAVMLYQDLMLSVFVFLIGPPLIFAVNYLMRRIRSVTRELVEINSRLLGAIQETVQGMAIVKAFTMEEQLSRKMSGLISYSEGRANKIASVSERTSPIAEILAGFAIAGVIAYASYRSLATGEPPGSVVAFITALMLAYDPARRLARMQVNLERALVNARMVYEILDIEPKQSDVAGAMPLAVKAGRIVFDKVDFSYIPAFPVLHGVSFVAAPGKVTAVVGSSGAGKSTMVALLQRFHDLDNGRVEIDGQDIAKVTKRSLRGAIAYVSQQPYLFEGTIRENIRYGRPDATDAEIEEAARLANADEFIRRQRSGYDTPLGENGVTLSGGQRQRLSIARAIVRKAPILLLDEATSALDNESEARVQEALESVMQGRTTIVIAHRLSTVVNAHHIVVMEDGHVAEEGTHAALLKIPNGVYARFHRLQSHRSLNLVDDTSKEPAMASQSEKTERS